MKEKNYGLLYSVPYLIILAMLVFYVFYSYKYLLNSDSAVKIMLSQAINREFSLIPSAWIYVNKDLWLGILTFPLSLLLTITENYFLAYSINSLFYIFLSLLLVEVFIKTINLDRLSISAWVIRAFFISSISPNYADFLFGEIAYLPMLILFLAQMILLVDLVNNKFSLSKKSIFCMVLIISVIMQNPSKHIVFTAFPFIGSLALMYLYKRIDIKIAVKGVIILFFVFVTSSIIYYYFSYGVQFSNGVGSLILANVAELHNNINIFIFGLFNFSGIMVGGIKSSSVLLAYGFMIFFSLLYFLARVLMKKEIGKEFFIIRSYIIFFLLIVLFLYIFTTPLAQNERTFRYFLPVYWGVFILSALYISSFDKIRERLSGCFILMVLIFGSAYSYVQHPLLSVVVEPYKKLEEVSSYLDSQGYDKGFATYWNAYKVKVISNSHYPILPIHDNLKPFYWLVDKKQYRPDENVKKSFLLLAPNESNLIVNNKITNYSSSRKEISGYTILTFDFDVSEIVYGKPVDLPNLGMDFSDPLLPSYIDQLKGFSHAEPEHRWSDGKRAQVKYVKNLPEDFILQLEVAPFGENTNELLKIKVGSVEKSIRLLPSNNTYSLAFKGVKANTIEFIIPKPVQPSVNGEIVDPRYVGVSFVNMSIVESRF